MMKFKMPRRRPLFLFGLVMLILAGNLYLFMSPKSRIIGPIRVQGSKFSHSKWIVLTSIKSPTEQIKNLSQIPGWKLLIVADKNTPVNWTLTSYNAIILSHKMQLSLKYEITKLLPWNTQYARKMIGYLYAIENGAKYIYDTVENNSPDDTKNFEKYFDFKSTTRGLVLNSSGMITANPYEYFGQPTIWPRGYPLEYIDQTSMSNITPHNEYIACQMSTPLIQQGLVNGDPDVNAILGLTQNKDKSHMNFQFDPSAPPLIFPKGVFAPLNSLNMVFHYDAFWGLLLPISVKSQVSDIWRGYRAQRLLWEIGGHVGFYSAHPTQHRNPHIPDFGEEEKLYKQSGGLIRFLKKWRCSGQDLYECMVELTSAMADRNFWAKSEIELAKAWISDLKSIGYKPPHFNPRDSPCLDGKLKSHVFSNGVGAVKKRQTSDRYFLRQFCNLTNDGDNSSSALQRQRQPIQFPTTLLVITYNHPHYENIWLLELVYRPHFPNIVYCGDFYNSSYHSKLLSTPNFVNNGINGFSFVSANLSNGYFAYECALRAIDMNYGVTGYLVLSDDDLLNIWNIGELSTNKTWEFLPHAHPTWHGWTDPFGRREAGLAMTHIYNTSTNVYLKEFRKQREDSGYNVTSMVRAISDIFYLPKIKQEMFYEVGTIFREKEVFLEIAVPMIMTGLSSSDNRIYFRGKNIWYDKRDSMFKFFNASNHFIHPVKLGDVINGTLKQDYCRQYVTRILEFYEKNNSE